MLLACAAPIVAQGRAIQSPVGRGLAWVETHSGAGVEDPAGSFVTVEVPEGVIISAFYELEGGWIAAGQRWTESGFELVLLRHERGTTDRIDPPTKESQAFRIQPVPLVHDGEFLGLAWLEGDGGENNSVMASRWAADAFETPQVVSPWSGEAQLALSGAVLADNSALLVWAAVREDDDDILWSRSSLSAPRADWSPPASVHPENDGADITPRIVASGDLALAAWSHFDGSGYRLRVARFDGDVWLETGITSERGVSHPIPFPAAGGATGFLYQTAAPSWVLIEIGSDGRLLRRAAATRLHGETRPLVSSDESQSVGLRFPSRGSLQVTQGAQPTADRIGWVELP